MFASMPGPMPINSLDLDTCSYSVHGTKFEAHRNRLEHVCHRVRAVAGATMEVRCMASPASGTDRFSSIGCEVARSRNSSCQSHPHVLCCILGVLVRPAEGGKRPEHLSRGDASAVVESFVARSSASLPCSLNKILCAHCYVFVGVRGLRDISRSLSRGRRRAPDLTLGLRNGEVSLVFSKSCGLAL